MPADDQGTQRSPSWTSRGEFHHQTHWYLPLIGVDGDKQGQGYRSVLLQFATERCDQDGLPAFLEATNPRNRALYERHGFEVVGEIQAGEPPADVAHAY